MKTLRIASMVLAIWLCWSGTESMDRKAQENLCRQREQQLVQETREFLEEEGFANSGIMLTRTTEADGSRHYTMTIHHGGIDRMCQEERDALMRRLEEAELPDTELSVLCRFQIL